MSQGAYAHLYVQAITFTATDPEYQNLIYDLFQNMKEYSSEELDQLDDYLDDLITSNLITKCTSNYKR